MVRKVLIVYYSDTGKTAKVAQHVGNDTTAIVEAIDTPVFGKGIWNYLKRAWFALRKKVIPIKDIENDPALFDLVVVGSPVWAGHLASPMRSYLLKYSNKISKIAFFVTLGSSGAKGAFKDMRQISGLTPIAELAINDQDRKIKQDLSMMSYFATQLGN